MVDLLIISIISIAISFTCYQAKMNGVINSFMTIKEIDKRIKTAGYIAACVFLFSFALISFFAIQTIGITTSMIDKSMSGTISLLYVLFLLDGGRYGD